MTIKKRMRPGRDAGEFSMPSTHTSLHYHLVFSTKSREAWFTPENLPRLHHFLGGILQTEGGFVHTVGGVADHVHALTGLKPTHCLADVMQRLKSVSSKWVHQELRMPGFAWQEGYGAFTVSASSLEQVHAYVENQEEHHRTHTFEEEYLMMLKRGLVQYDDRYLW